MAAGSVSFSALLIDNGKTSTFERKKEERRERKKGRKIRTDDGQADRQMDGLVGINSSGDISSGHTVDVDIFSE